MASREREVILGTIVFVAVVIVVVGSVWLSERYAGASGGYRLQVHFESISGLQRGNSVTIRGVRVGKVLEIALKNGRPVVAIGFEKLKGLPRDSKVLLKDEGLLGQQIIEVRLGSDLAGLFADGDELEGVSKGGVGSLTAHAAEAAQRLNLAVEDIVNEDNLSHIQNILVQMDSTTASLRTILDENRGTISETFDSLAVASAVTREIVEDSREGIGQGVENLRLATERLAKMSENLEASSASIREMFENLNAVSKKLRDGKGTLGRLVSEEEVYMKIQRTLTFVDSLLEDIKRDPSHYFNVKFSLF